MSADRSNPTQTPLRESIDDLVNRPRAQVLVIGGGINGLATFRDLALQGVDVVLVERGDFASGASSASSHMIHGGIRYLENGELRLVRESVQERNGLLKIAPHYVKPLQTTIPIYSTFSGILAAPLRLLTHKQGKPQERGALLIKVGLVIYYLFSRHGGSVPRHRFLGRRKALAELTELNPNLKYTATYYDASMHDPERLALDVLRDGLDTGSSARAVNYVEAIGGSADGVLLRDRESGREFTFRADVVVNAAGPWTDLTNDAMGTPSEYMGGTKGSHIVLDNPRLLAATRGREIFFENNDGRIVLIYPLKGRVLVGTTDLEADARETPVCTEEEIDYFFDLVSHVYPSIVVDRSQIVYTFSGIRPLPKHDDTKPGFVSRDYRIVTETSATLGVPVLSLVGGKWTTFRALAEHLSTEVLSELGRTREVSTEGRPIGGGAGYPRSAEERDAWVAARPLSRERTSRLLEQYGTRADEVIAFLGDDSAEHLIEETQLSIEEVAYFASVERAVHVSDVIFRRTSLAFVGAVTAPVLDAIGAAMAHELGWSAQRLEREIADTVQELSLLHGVHVHTRAGAA
ncbi:glycerol-3-phosphate dehydrogenase/oxidase [soil metagenome]